MLAAAAEAPDEVVVVCQGPPKTYEQMLAEITITPWDRETRQTAPAPPEINYVDVNSAEVRQDLAALDELVESIRSTGLYD